jgi:acyl-CoA synthetase (AMP-forming)/AMP-acid ligase II
MAKGAVRTHGLLIAQYHALAGPLELDDGGVDLVTLPVFVLANLAAGLTSVLADTDLSRPGAPRAAAVAAQCRRLGVTRVTASPAFLAGLMAVDAALPEFRKIFTGGGPVFPDFVRRLAARLPEAEIHPVYGSTEAEPICHATRGDADGHCGTTAAGGGLAAGRPARGTEVRIIRDAWGQPLGPMTGVAFDTLTLAAGQAGEIVVAGPQVLPGYLDGAGDAETKIRVDGRVFHRTGDAGWLDGRGRLWLLGRCAARMPRPARAMAVAPGVPDDAACYPFAVECALREKFPVVRTAALEWCGKRLLVLAGTDEIALAAAAWSAVEDWQMDETLVVPAIPLDRRHNAKIDYPALRALVARRLERG